jgi:cellulose biosynthesis protein BcsQ
MKDTPKVIAVASGKGGIGKSSLTCTLAVRLAQLEPECRVLVFDADGQSMSSTDYFLREVDPDEIEQANAYHVLTERQTVDRVARRSAAGVDVVAAHPMMSRAGAEMMSDRGAILRMRSAILSGDHDLVLIDCPPSLDSFSTAAALYSADLVLAPTSMERWCRQGLGLLLDEVNRVERTRGGPPLVRVVPSIVTLKEAETLRFTLEGVVAVTARGFYKSAEIRRAMQRAVPVREGTPSWSDVNELAREVLGVLG